jgi:hypothetical protein
VEDFRSNRNQFNQSYIMEKETNQLVLTDAEILSCKEAIRDSVLQGIINLLNKTPIIIDKDNPNAGLTLGQVAVGVKFNPSQKDEVYFCKQLFALSIDLMKELMTIRGRGEAARHASIAITQIEEAQMRAVKALTWQD